MKRLNLKRLLRRSAWACFALALIVAIIWLASGWHGCAYGWRSSNSVTLATGWIEYSFRNSTRSSFNVPFTLPSIGPADGWYIWSRQYGPHWRFDLLIESTSFQTTYGIPLWPVPPALLALGGLLLLIIRTRVPYLCTHCRYDRRGLPASAPCPECGTNPKPTDKPT